MIYLDHNATTPIADEVQKAIQSSLKHDFGNPSSSHAYGLLSRAAIADARRAVASLVKAETDEIFFTSGGTESNNLAILGTAARFDSGHIIASCIEHPSVMNPLKYLSKRGFDVTWLPVDSYGHIDIDDLGRSIRKDTILISVMHSNNETGSVQPIAAAGAIARGAGIAFHCDAAQSVGKVHVSVRRLKVDMMTIVSHKFYGPKGIGAIYIRRGQTVSPLFFGASHERGLRPGTENVPGIAGLGKASEIAARDLAERIREMKRLNSILFSELRSRIPGIKLNGHRTRRLPNTLNVSLPGARGADLLELLGDKIAASTGSACHEGLHSPSPVLKSMGLSDNRSLSALRLSLGIINNERQVRQAARAIAQAYRTL